ncbi:hypothetical protein Hanom_Chr04g00348401 [Helianthus anomalus]
MSRWFDCSLSLSFRVFQLVCVLKVLLGLYTLRFCDRVCPIVDVFFWLTKNDNWVTFETSQVVVCLTSSMVTTFGSWKDRFFWIFESIVPFELVVRHSDDVLNDLEPFESELNNWLLKVVRKCL